MIGRYKGELTGRHVFIAMLIFFGIVIAANGAFIFLALDSWTGLSTRDAYQRGLDYNETLRDAEAQRALGWQVAVAFTDHGDRRGQIEVSFRDQAGAPIEDLRVTSLLTRPTHEGFDELLNLTHSVAGRYIAEFRSPLLGQWNLEVTATSPQGAHYTIKERIWLK